MRRWPSVTGSRGLRPAYYERDRATRPSRCIEVWLGRTSLTDSQRWTAAIGALRTGCGPPAPKWRRQCSAVGAVAIEVNLASNLLLGSRPSSRHARRSRQPRGVLEVSSGPPQPGYVVVEVA